MGPAGPDLMAERAHAALARVEPGDRFLRTARHPAAAALDVSASFDSLYEAAETLNEVYEGIVDALVSAANERGEVVYIVPGSPLVAERTVELLREAAARGDVTVDIVPGLSFL